MRRIEQYRVELRRLTDWEAYLKKNSGLPGARANLELVEAVGEEADPERLWRLSASSDEFLALCGTAGLGHARYKNRPRVGGYGLEAIAILVGAGGSIRSSSSPSTVSSEIRRSAS